ncbi:hypothetical protein AAEO57_09885 [Flavobacterium sp. DGU38]|uniref:Secreted protein n=1 Tax=Flavobacterium calami TaxID=3139144 RepID=A0ABU9INR3_9FLAO
MPIAVIALGISGAFVTTSMQSASKANPPQIGYPLNAQGGCNENIPQSCDNTPKAFLCRVGGGTAGPQAFGKDAQGNCVQTLWRP